MPTLENMYVPAGMVALIDDEVERNVGLDLGGLRECRSGGQHQAQHADDSEELAFS